MTAHLKVSWWNTNKHACSRIAGRFVDVSQDGIIETYSDGKTVLHLDDKNREGHVIIEIVEEKL